MEPNVPKPTATADDPYRYGHRERIVTRPDGSTEFVLIPLTLDDVLRPEEDDKIAHNRQHAIECRYLADVFSRRPLSPPHAGVTEDQRVDWPSAGVTGLCPDLGVFVGLNRPLHKKATFDAEEFGATTVFLLEIVSPGHRENDVVTKMKLYHDAGVPFYVIVDQEEEDGPREIRAYRWVPKSFVEVPLDAKGRARLPGLNLLLGLGADRVVCYDAATGAEVGDYDQVSRNLEEADRRNEQQSQALEEHVLARQEAEREARDQKSEAEKQKQEAEKQKQEAEKQKQEAERERKANELATQRIRELEDLLRSLQQQGNSPPFA